MGMPADIRDPQHELGQDFLREKVSGNQAPKVGTTGYPFYGGGAWSLASGAEAPIGHSGTAQVKQAPSPKSFSAGGRQSASAVPAIYAGNPDLTNGGR
jgi:hypothetical protein